MKAIWSIFRKELVDAMRDRRTIMVVLFSSILGVPMMLFLLSEIISHKQDQEEKRTVLVRGMQAAPTLENYLRRQFFVVKEAPDNYEKQLRDKDLTQPVLLVPDDFERKLATRELPRLLLVSDKANEQSQSGLEQVKRLLKGFEQERVSLDLMMRGVGIDTLRAVDIQEQYIKREDDRGLSLTAMLPFFLMTAILMGGMFAAIDTMAGERERGSLEPLLMNPVSDWQLAIGKWGAVAAIAMLIVVMVVASFFPAQWLVRNEFLRAEFQFGIHEALGFLLVLLPLAASVVALQIALSLSCKTAKEAQARMSMLTMPLNMLPLLVIINPGREPTWFQWVPMLAQTVMMNHVLKGEALQWQALGAAATVALAMIVGGLYVTARQIRKAV